MKLSLLNKNKNVNILGTKVDCADYKRILKKIDFQISKKQSHFICVAAVHLLMEARKDSLFQKKINQSLATTSDGMPLVWLAKLKGQKQTQRVYGPELMLQLCHLAEQKEYKIFLLGGAKGQGKILKKKLLQQFPNLKIAGYTDTPKRPIPELENQKIIKQINQSKTTIVFVGLGCPIQEKWMINHYQQLDVAVCLGVGAAFDFISGKIKQAPPWMQNNGLEWLFRLIQEPKRLWKRYLLLNCQFVLALLKEQMIKK